MSRPDTPPETSTCRNCGTPISRHSVVAAWRGPDHSSACTGGYYHQPVTKGR